MVTKAITTKNNRLIVLDVNTIIHRSYNELPDFAARNRELTGAL